MHNRRQGVWRRKYLVVGVSDRTQKMVGNRSACCIHTTTSDVSFLEPTGECEIAKAANGVYSFLKSPPFCFCPLPLSPKVFNQISAVSHFDFILHWNKNGPRKRVEADEEDRVDKFELFRKEIEPIFWNIFRARFQTPMEIHINSSNHIGGLIDRILL